MPLSSRVRRKAASRKRFSRPDNGRSPFPRRRVRRADCFGVSLIPAGISGWRLIHFSRFGRAAIPPGRISARTLPSG